MKNRIIVISVCAFFLLLKAIFSREISIIISFFVFLYAGHFLFRKATIPKKLFFYTFCLYVLMAVVFTSIHQMEHGTPFTGLGEDDKGFYEIAKEFKNGATSFAWEGLQWKAINYKAYIYLLSGWLKVLNFIGFNSDYYFNLNILNCFFGAMAAPLLFLIFSRWVDDSLAYKIAIFTMLYPPIIYYSAAIIRDTLMVALFPLGVLLAQNTSLPRLLKIVFYILLLVFLINIRDVSALVMFIFLSLTWIFHLNSKAMTPILKLAGGVAVVAVFSFFLYFLSRKPLESSPQSGQLLDYVTHKVHFYFDLSEKESGSGSLGGKIRSSKNPVLLALAIPITFFSPAPPLFIYHFSLSHFFMGLGNILWYFFGFTYSLALIISRFKNIAGLHLPMVITFGITLVLVSFTSGDFRHLYFFHPFLIGFSLIFLSTNKKYVPLILNFFLGLSLIFILAYIVLKVIF
jgi:hypothetical protein